MQKNFKKKNHKQLLLIMVLRYKKNPLTIPFKAIKMLLFPIEILKAYESTQFIFIESVFIYILPPYSQIHIIIRLCLQLTYIFNGIINFCEK